MDRRRKYDWAAIQCYYDEGHSIRECSREFGFVSRAWHKAKVRGEIRPRPQKRDILLVLRNAKSRTNVKRRLLCEGLLEPRCSWCGISSWARKPLSIQLDHINGVNDDYRLENLRMLCPNCHSLTDTYGFRKRLPDDPPSAVRDALGRLG